MILLSHHVMYMWILSYLQSGQTALMKASSGGYVECVKLLLLKGADVKHKDWVSAVSLSVWHVLLCNKGELCMKYLCTNIMHA